MRLQTYINEEYEVDHVIKVLQRDCKKFIDFIRLYKPTPFVYRGVTRANDDYTTKTTRTNRKPVDTPKYTHDILDELFYDKFGWKPRSEGVFTWTKEVQGYGKMNLFFPIGDFKFVWSPKVKDLYVDLNNLTKEIAKINSKYIMINEPEKKIEEEKLLYKNKLVDTYVQNKNYTQAFNKRREIVWKCKGYHLVNIDYFEQHKDKFMEMF
jgi:hypothetical protein